MSASAISIEKLDVGQLTEAQATLLMPLWARAVESRREDPLLKDDEAERIVESLDFDFGRFEAKSVPVVDYCLRASVVDQVVQQFVDDHPTGTVVEVGVGLDTRFDRLDNAAARWFELDLPAVMQLRCRFFADNEQRTMMAGSLLDDCWMNRVVKESPAGPILFVAEGVFYFFQRLEIEGVMRRLADRFPLGEIVFDAQSPWFLMVSNWRHPLRDSRLEFSLGSAVDVEQWDDRLRLKQAIGFGDSPYYDQGMKRVSNLRRWARRLLPPVRHLFKVVHVTW